jgi:DNA-binding transcriptional LysR family regulator
MSSHCACSSVGSTSIRRSHSLVRVLDKYSPQIPGYFLYYPSRLNLAPKLKVLIDFLKQSNRPRRTAR